MPYKVAVTSPSFSNNSFLVELAQKKFGKVKLNEKGERLSGPSLTHFIGDASAVIVGLEKIDEIIFEQCPHLRFVSKYGVGLDNISARACEKFGIKIGWTGGVNRLSVAEMTLGFMLGLVRNLYPSSLYLKEGQWKKNGGVQLTGKTIGIIGVGHVGKEVIRLLQPFDCHILVNDIVEQKEYYQQNGLIEATKDEILGASDVISLHVPLTDETHHLITLPALKKMKRIAFLINTSRGSIVHQDHLKIALQTGIISGAAVDVYDAEPPLDIEFLKLKNLFCTPHIGGNSLEAVEAMGRAAIDHICEFFNR